ncbi:hypothetical protein GCM10027162_38640 [Streptomyces incanus]
MQGARFSSPALWDSIKSTNDPAGRVSLLYNASNGYNCVVTMYINGYVGFGSTAEAGILVEGGGWKRDRVITAIAPVPSVRTPPISA